MSELKEQILQLQNHEGIKNKIAELKVLETQYNEKVKELSNDGVQISIRIDSLLTCFSVESYQFYIRIPYFKEEQKLDISVDPKTGLLSISEQPS